METLAESEGYASKSELVRELIRRKWDEWADKAIRLAKKHPEEFEGWKGCEKGA